jgi:hypothetical protein
VTIPGSIPGGYHLPRPAGLAVLACEAHQGGLVIAIVPSPCYGYRPLRPWSAALTQWQSFFWPLLVANAPQYQMVQVALTNFQTQYVTVWNQLFAAATITSIVPVIMLLGLQRYYVQSVAGTGLKG